MLKVTVLSDALRRVAYTSKRTGQPGEVAFQTLWLHTCDAAGQPGPFPEKVEVFAPRAADGAPQPWPPGEYTLHPASLYVSDGRPAVSVRLTPIVKAPTPSK